MSENAKLVERLIAVATAEIKRSAVVLRPDELAIAVEGVVRLEAASALGETVAWDDPRVQAVYEILCDLTPPPEGEHWGFEIRATSRDDAEARIRAMGWAKVKGPVVIKIPVPLSYGYIGRFWRWLFNQRDG